MFSTSTCSRSSGLDDSSYASSPTVEGLDARIGSIAPGKDADLILVKGDPSTNIDDIENVQIVFKDGVGYDPAALLASVKGRYGQY